MSSSISTIPLASQVGGHAGVLTSEDGSLLIKPASPPEHQFYQSLNTNPAFDALRPFVPKFLGTLKLEGQVDETNQGLDPGSGIAVKQLPEAHQKDEWSSMSHGHFLVLENLLHHFIRPNILDIKLGTVLYDEDSSAEKVARMEKTARNTTSLETGVRLTGFQVYDNATNEAVNTPKSYGKSIKPSDLSEGIARFFPALSVYNTQGLPPKLLVPVLKGLREDIAEIREAFASVDLRMVGGSLLIVYEGDLAKAEDGAKWMLEEEDEEGEDDDDDDDEKLKRGPPYTVKLIDFAHTRFVPGQGPDEGVLKGFDTVQSLLDGRLKEVESA
ncbi:SAICAR synthase-like protein [Guyanagaster necrorhizus]|uniref:Kinase n=1 Tax=Guyanagaster necrorhizus TaxID=856835 RepID=A0A9P7W4A4_9AGAR|nr:SAICAR synthase-like protein [Guyanagaster necrorhizus MCA 3950]KAG7453151.1 SAICAR synthase-like protein [Guyanagaster necrorhizus MCA 3950]